MGLFDRFRSDKKEEKKPKKSGGHGDHWGAVAESEQDIMHFVEGALENAGTVDHLKLDDQDVHACFSKDTRMKTCSITVDNQMWTAYPVCNEGIPHEIVISGVEEWANGIEGQVLCGLKDAGIAFFDPLYYKSRDAYQPDSKYTVNLAAIAYSLFKAEPRTIEDPEGREISTKGMAAFFPFQNGDVDDYSFQVPVKEVEEITYGNKEMFKLKVPLFRSSGNIDMDIYLYASKAVSKDYVPQVGDDITGILWLQGHLQ